MEEKKVSNLSKSKKLKKKSYLRWKMLANVLCKNQPQYDVSGVSIRSFSSFGFLTVSNTVICDGLKWVTYTSDRLKNKSLHICFPLNPILLKNLTGFNNTGNVGVWPSEEIMLTYCLKNDYLFNDKVVLELGGGMSCMAGMAILAALKPMKVILTDGNQDSVSNLSKILHKNFHYLEELRAETRLLLWQQKSDYIDLEGSIDVLLCADCLFFDESRSDLVGCIDFLLKSNGCCLIFAPSRGGTFEKFESLATSRFQINIYKDYDHEISKVHQQKESSAENGYLADLHYPLLMVLKKRIT